MALTRSLGILCDGRLSQAVVSAHVHCTAGGVRGVVVRRTHAHLRRHLRQGARLRRAPLRRALPRGTVPSRLPGAGAPDLRLPAAREDGALLRAATLRVPLPPHAQLRAPRVPGPLLRRRLPTLQRGVPQM